MTELTYKDLEIIKDSLSEALKTFEGNVLKQRPVDSAYLKIYKAWQEIKLYCEASGIKTDEISQLPVKLDYDLEDINTYKAQKENLTFDF